MKKLITTTAALMLATAIAPAYARADRFHDRLERQAERIEQGIDSGELNRKEAKILRHQHRDLRQLTRLLADDGHLSKRERRTLRRSYDDASDLIWQLKHNDERRPRHGHRTETPLDRHALVTGERRIHWHE
jgi:hypothetical protein